MHGDNRGLIILPRVLKTQVLVVVVVVVVAQWLRPIEERQNLHAHVESLSCWVQRCRLSNVHQSSWLIIRDIDFHDLSLCQLLILTM